MEIIFLLCSWKHTKKLLPVRLWVYEWDHNLKTVCTFGNMQWRNRQACRNCGRRGVIEAFHTSPGQNKMRDWYDNNKQWTQPNTAHLLWRHNMTRHYLLFFYHWGVFRHSNLSVMSKNTGVLERDVCRFCFYKIVDGKGRGFGGFLVKAIVVMISKS